MPRVDVAAALDSIADSLAARAWTDAERSTYCAAVGEHPLFAPASGGGGGGDADSAAAAAARAAVAAVEYDELDSPLALAAEAKERGNAAFAAGAPFFSHALRHYADALRHARAAGAAAAADAPAARALAAAAHANAAAVHLAGGHPISALDAAREALRAGGGAKPAWRAARACVALGRAQAALDFCALGRALAAEASAAAAGGAPPPAPPAGDAFAGVAAEAAALLRVQRARDDAGARAAGAAAASLAAVRAACAERRISVGPPLYGNLRRTAAAPYVDARGELHWPLVVLYPESGQSDWLDDVGEAARVGDVVDEVLAEAPAWAAGAAARAAYAPAAVDVFFKARPCRAAPLARAWAPEAAGDEPEDDPRGSEWVHVPREAPLLLVLAQPAYVVADVPLLYVVPRGGAAWEAMRRDAGGRFAQLVVPDFGEGGGEG